jgi:polar amino acid transport system permease protein
MTRAELAPSVPESRYKARRRTHSADIKSQNFTANDNLTPAAPADPAASAPPASRSMNRSRLVHHLREAPWWLFAIVGLFVSLGYKVFSADVYQQIFAAVGSGVSITIFVTLVAFALATLLGLLVALAFQAPFLVVRQFARFYCELVRGIPVLVLLFYMAFVAAPLVVDCANFLLTPARDAQLVPLLETRDFSLLWRAILALTISYSAFIAEVFRAGLQAVDKGQLEAAKALGLSRWAAFRHVRFPLAFRTILPPLGNDFISMIKDSALVSVLGVGDITQMAKVYASGSFQFFETYNVVALVYLMMTIGLSLALRGLEKRLRRHLAR